MRRFSLFIIALASVSLSGCRHVYAPQPPGANAPPLQVPPSHIAVTATIPLSAPQAAINAAIPEREDADDYTVSVNGGADNCGSGASIGYHIHRSQITLSGSGNTLAAQADIAYNAIGRGRPKLVFGLCGPLFSASCGRGEPEPHLGVGLSVSVGGINPNWTPNVAVSPANVVANGACKLSIFNVHVENNVADLARNAINSSSSSAQSGIVHALDLPSKANKAWVLLQTPVKIAPSAWLSIQPKQIGILPFTVSANNLQAGLQLQATPLVTFGTAAPPASSDPLPPPSAVPASNSYFISLPIEAEYSVMKKQIADALQVDSGGMRYPPTGKNYVKIKDVDVYAYGAQAVVRLDLDVHGVFGRTATLYLAGTPTFDAGMNVISIPDLDFTVDSKNILLKLAVWLEQSALRDSLRSKARLNISPYVMQAKQLVLSGINRDIGPITLTGTVDTINVLGVYASPVDRTFKAYLQTSGTLNATLK